MDSRAVTILFGIITIITALWQLIDIIEKIIQINVQTKSGRATGSELITAVIIIGLAASIMHGVTWHLVERWFGWTFGAGGGEAMPAGYQAVILSITLVMPLIILPPIYQLVTGKQILPEKHSLASVAILVTAAIAHLVMYGTNAPKITGLKELIYPVGEKVDVAWALLAEAVYAVVYFSAIVFVYRLIVRSNTLIGPHMIPVLFRPYMTFMSVWFLGLASYICLMYPLSIEDKTWVQVRGVLSALWLELMLVSGMLL